MHHGNTVSALTYSAKQSTLLAVAMYIIACEAMKNIFFAIDLEYLSKKSTSGIIHCRNLIDCCC